MNQEQAESMSEDRARPFSSGTQYADWRYRNCDRCTKQYDEAARKYVCQIEEAIGMAAVMDGSVSQEMSVRMGYAPLAAARKFPLTWDCPERESVGGGIVTVAAIRSRSSGGASKIPCYYCGVDMRDGLTVHLRAICGGPQDKPTGKEPAP